MSQRIKLPKQLPLGIISVAYRPHQGLGNMPLSPQAVTPPGDPPKVSEVRCQEFLGGWLKHYHRESA